MTPADQRLLDRALDHHRLITRHDVTRVGLSSAQWQLRLERNVWVGVAPGVWRHRATPDSWQLRARAATLWAGRDAALYGRTSLAWWGLDPRPVDVVELLMPRRRRATDPPFVVHTTTMWSAADLRTSEGVRLTEPGRAIIDMVASEPSAHTIEGIIDEAIRRRMTTVERLTTRLATMGGRGRSGSKLLRSLLLDSGGESYLERRFLRLLRTSGFPRPRCQVVHRRDGVHIARVDFHFPGTNVVVEVSGRLGHVSDADRRRDAHRRNALQQNGRMVIEFTTADVLDGADYVVVTLRDSLHVAP